MFVGKVPRSMRKPLALLMGCILLMDALGAMMTDEPIVQIAIPIVPTIRVLVTFTKFEELQPMEEFSTPLSSPAHFHDSKAKENEGSISWISWMRGSRGGQSSECESHSFHDEVDPFHIPSDYVWVDAKEKKRRMKAKKAKNKKHKKHGLTRNPDVARRLSEDAE